ncbi:MAG: ABC transporter ATP-binding protein [Saprospirales bacterium]|nr:MAG: ABC transporter ATP-binding protein [Saprospirales bacterium]
MSESDWALTFKEFRIESKKGQVKPLLHIPSLNFKRGEITSIIGESGAGKSLTGLSIGGFLPKGLHASGEIVVNSKAGQSINVLKAGTSELRELRVFQLGFVMQQPLSAFNPVLRIGKQLTERLQKFQPNRSIQLKTLDELLKSTGFKDPTRILNNYPHQLSGGQLQRVALIMAVSTEPDILVADEPTSALDSKTGTEVLDLMTELCRRKNCNLLLITHDLQIAREKTDRIVVLKEGTVRFDGSPAEAIHTEDEYTTSLFKKYDFFYHSTILQPGLIQNESKTPASAAGQVKLEQLSLQYRQTGILSTSGGFLALKNIDLDFKKGCKTGIWGPTGSGKSSLAKILCGLESPTSGRLLFGENPFIKGLRAPDFPNIQMIFQDAVSSFNPARSIKTQLSGIYRGSGKDEEERIWALMEKCGLEEELINRLPSQLSGGQIQRFAIIRALLTEPEGIVFDEFVTTLDIHWKIEVIKLLQTLVLNKGINCWVVSHERKVLDHLCDEIIRIENGQVAGREITG